jgi:hypothetical protein
MILQTRGIEKQKLKFTDDDKFIIEQFYKLVKRYISMRQFMSGIERYQIDTLELNMYHICDVLTEEITKKYGK